MYRQLTNISKSPRPADAARGRQADKKKRRKRERRERNGWSDLA